MKYFIFTACAALFIYVFLSLQGKEDLKPTKKINQKQTYNKVAVHEEMTKHLEKNKIQPKTVISPKAPQHVSKNILRTFEHISRNHESYEKIDQDIIKNQIPRIKKNYSQTKSPLPSIKGGIYKDAKNPDQLLTLESNKSTLLTYHNPDQKTAYSAQTNKFQKSEPQLSIEQSRVVQLWGGKEENRDFDYLGQNVALIIQDDKINQAIYYENETQSSYFYDLDSGNITLFILNDLNQPVSEFHYTPSGTLVEEPSP